MGSVPGLAALLGVWCFRVSYGISTRAGCPAGRLVLWVQCQGWLPCWASGFIGSVPGLATLLGVWHYVISAGQGWVPCWESGDM